MKSFSGFYNQTRLVCSKKVIATGFSALLLFAVLITLSQYESTKESTSQLVGPITVNRKLHAVETRSIDASKEKSKLNKPSQNNKDSSSTPNTTLRLDYINIIHRLLEDNRILQHKLNNTLKLLRHYVNEEAIWCSEKKLDVEVDKLLKNHQFEEVSREHMQYHKTSEKEEPKIHFASTLTKNIEKPNFEQAAADNSSYKTTSEEEHHYGHTTESLHLPVKHDFSTSLTNLNSTANDSKLLKSNTKSENGEKIKRSTDTSFTEDNLAAENQTTGS